MKRLVMALLFVVFAAASCAPAGEQDRALPDAKLEILTGGTYDLRQTGQPRALNLWATWCAPCRAELPAFDHVASRVSDVAIVGINVGDAGPDAAELVEELDLGFTQVLDPFATVQQTLRITGLPATVFVDANGNVVEIHSGELNVDELETILTDLFGTAFT